MAVTSVIKTTTIWLTEITVKCKELRREYKIMQLSLVEFCGSIQLASQHAATETFVFPRRQTVKLLLLPRLLQP